MPKSLPSQLRFVSIFACGLLLVAALALSQSATAPQTGQTQPPSSSPQSDDSQEPTTTLKINVNVVQLFFNVKDKHGTLIPSLTKDDFEISEERQASDHQVLHRRIEPASNPGHHDRLQRQPAQCHRYGEGSGRRFPAEDLRPKDDAFVISFDINVDLLQDFTRDIHRSASRLNKAKVNTDYSSGGIPGMGGGPIPQP